ncbi:MAG: DNA primase [candidate division Zixibacteria bacterium]
MAARIPENKIDEVRMAADIAEVLSGYLPLKKRGRNFMALCPFHDEKTPSFSVSPEKQIFHCFGCGKGGNVFTFLMEHENLSFIEAIKLLADRYGVVLPKYEKEKDTRTERLLYANQTAAEYFQSNLSDSRYKQKIENYLYDVRGLEKSTIDKFQIGLATDDWQGLVDYARKKDIKPEELAEAGLASKSDKTGEYYDRFRIRLMIPIFDITGKIVAFGGRALKKGESAKYINSPETPLYNKSFILYGLNFAKQAIRESGSAILVEGYFDLIALHQAGIENVIAVSGTSFTPQQARLIHRYASKAYIFFDADVAGRSAALRSIENFYNADIEPLIVSTPPKFDPDTFVRNNGAEAVQKLIQNHENYILFRFGDAKSHDFSSREKERIAKAIKSLASKINDPLKRDILIASAAERLNLKISSLRSTTPRDTNQIPLESTRNINILESELLSLCVNHPPLIELIWNDISPNDFSGPGHGDIYANMLEAYKRTGEINPDKMIESIKDPSLVSGLAFISTLDWGDIDLTGVVKEYRQMLLNQKRNRQITQLKEQLAAAEEKGDRELSIKLTTEINYLLEKKV